MTQPPQGGPGPLSGHPEPDPVPLPEPEPPQPIPPPEPVPPPEPPHAVPAATTDFIDGDPPVPPVEWPPVGAYPGEPGHPDAAPGPATDGTPTEPIPAIPGPPTEPIPITHGPPTEPIPVAPGPPTEPAATPGSPTGPGPQPGPYSPGWQQPAPTQPWHAQHERPGEWQTRPPEHLAWQHSPPAESGPEPPIWAGSPAPYPPWQVPLAPAAPKRRGGLWVSLALTVILLLCGGGAVSAYFLISNADTGKGAPDPGSAVNRFMTAVYTQQNPEAAGQVVCRQARDKQKLAARVSQITNYANDYQGPTFRWSEPVVNGQTTERAVVTTTLTLTTEDEKQSVQLLTFTTIHQAGGWLVCDVTG